MKNVFKLFGIIAVLVIIGFSMSTCEMLEDGQSIVGTWYNSEINYKWDFNKDGSFMLSHHTYVGGTYYTSGDTLTLKWGWGDIDIYTYSRSGNNLTLTNENGQSRTYTYIK